MASVSSANGPMLGLLAEMCSVAPCVVTLTTTMTNVLSLISTISTTLMLSVDMFLTMDTTICKHALEHLQAREAYVRDDIFEMESTTDPETAFKPPSAARVPAVKQNIHSYADILRLYAMAMFFESSEYLELEARP